MGFSSDTPTLGSSVGSEFFLGAGLWPTSPYLGFRFLSSWVKFPICQIYLPGTASQHLGVEGIEFQWEFVPAMSLSLGATGAD